MEIDFNASPNFAVGRSGFSPEAFVFHVTEGNFSGALEWCLNPASKVSYHYIVKENGAITQLVEDKDTAWHAGQMTDPTPYGKQYAPNPNLRTIGIAYAGFALAGPSFEQICAICGLVRQLSVIHTIPIDRKHLIFHNDIRTDKVCPGPRFSLDALIYLAQLK